MYFILSLTIFLNFKLASGFNIDTNHVIVHSDPSRSSNGRSSYFGYSVIMYSNDDMAWVQIGTPRGNISNYKSITEPGVVYRCNIFEPCSLIDVNALSTYNGTQNFDISKELLSGSWIGGTMDIHPQSSLVVICGYRWKRSALIVQKKYFMQGVCFRSRVNESNSEKIIPLLKSIHYDIIETDPIKTNLNKKEGKNVLYYAEGQAGTSAHFTNAQELLLGAPGLNDWHGTTIIVRDPKAPFNEFTRRGAGQRSFLNVVAEREKPAEDVSYEFSGYSTTSGYYFSKTELLYATGAPRDRYKGQVQIFKFLTTSNKTEVKTFEEGQQVGEYFGGALTSGDINRDGLDDLIVGAPFYGSSSYNQGRIYIFLGSSQGKFEIPGINSIIASENIGGQFGASLMFLGDFSNDGYSSVAVGAPYENDGSGSVYIYRGTEVGLTILSQKLIGTSFVPTIKGFGISISKPTDVDANSYKDLAIGAYLSGHVIILRSKPIINIDQSLTSLTTNLDTNSKEFVVTACFWYTGYSAPLEISITRNITVDKLQLRAFLDPTIPLSENITLKYNTLSCQNITINLQNLNNNRNDSITVTISSDLILQPDELNTITVSRGSTNASDTFCKTCPMLNPYLSAQEKSIAIPFVLGCGDDNLCKTNLSLFTNFLNIQNNNYVLGSTEDLDVIFTIHNSAENAYQTKIIIELSKSVYIRKIPNFCSDLGESIIICNIGSIIMQNENRTINVTLDMRNIDTIKYGDTLDFKTTLETSSQNLNKRYFVDTLKVSRNADILITGNAAQQSYIFDNSTKDIIQTFTHTLQLEKYGISPIEEVVLTMSIPSGVLQSELVGFARFYTPHGTHGNQPIYCRSNAEYLSYEFKETAEQFLIEDTKNASIVKRSVDNAIDNNETHTEFGYALNRIFNINCSNDGNILCSKIECNIGPFTNKQNVAKIQLDIRLNISALADQLGTKDIIVLSTEGKVVIKSPINFVQNGSRPDEVRISSVFIKEIPEVTVEYWIIIVAVFVGIALLGLLTIGLIKAGFFKRTMKEDLKALQESEELLEFGKQPVRPYNDEDQQTIDLKS